ncbi:MAG TPA: serine hydrolase [Anaerolineales bacterium]|nr:serine hydrolase [Anaerolineales bacterium]
MFNLEPVLEQAKGKLIAIAFQDLETDTDYYLNADLEFHPASTFKVHVMMEVFRQANEGLLSLEERLPIVNSFSSIGDGSRYSLNVEDDAERTLYPRRGETESIYELTRLMIVRSSNLATNILIKKVGTENINEFIRSLGIEGVTVRRGVEDNVAFRQGMNNSATARGLTQTMDLIARRKVVSEEASENMIQILLGQEFNESIPALLPNFVKVAHKTGWTNDFYHDTGIVFPQEREPYVLTIMTKGFTEDTESEAHECMANLSKLIYEQLP